jgi:hypothetical protein
MPTFDAGQTGLTGAVGVTVYEEDGSLYAARTMTGITEPVAGSGVYSVADPDPDLTLTLVWDVGVGTVGASETLYAGRGQALDLTPVLTALGSPAQADDLAELAAVAEAVRGKTELIGTGTINVVSQVDSKGNWNPLVAGDDYVGELYVKVDGLDLTGATVVCNVGNWASNLPCTVTPLVDDPDGCDWTVTVDDLPASVTSKATRGVHGREFEATIGGRKRTFGRAQVTVLGDRP